VGVVWTVCAALTGTALANATAAVQVKAAGATFPLHVYERWTQRFEVENPGVTLRYVGTGSGDGIHQARARTVQIGGTDDPLTPQQLRDSQLVQIPMLVGGLVPVVHLPGVGPNQMVLSGEVLADIMLGNIGQWRDARIAALNPGLRLPDLPIRRIVREEASGSTAVWTRYLGLSSARFAAAVPVSQKPRWRGAVLQARGNDGVAALLRDTPGGITYVSYDRVQKDRLSGVRLREPGGAVVSASEEAFRAAILASDVYRKGDDTAGLLAVPKADAWPLTATSFVLLDAAPRDPVAAEWVSRFVYWCFMHGDELTRGTGFAPLPERVQAKLTGRLMQIHGPDGQVPKFVSP
jgi:phosphate transport system substrate-binding protein